MGSLRKKMEGETPCNGRDKYKKKEIKTNPSVSCDTEVTIRKPSGR
jgi:hypothetical protein